MNRSALLLSRSLAVAETFVGDEVAAPPGGRLLSVESAFVYGSGGTTAKLYLQTSLDGGLTWFDVACHAFDTSTLTKVSALTRFVAPASQAFAPTDGTLADNTVVNGVLGDRVRAKLKVVAASDYDSTTIAVNAVFA